MIGLRRTNFDKYCQVLNEVGIRPVVIQKYNTKILDAKEAADRKVKFMKLMQHRLSLKRKIREKHALPHQEGR